MNFRIFLGALAGAALVTSACDEPAEPGPAEPREVFFDGAEIHAELEQDPDALFLVELREGTVHYFDQTDVAIDFSKFVLDGPAMSAPVPMLDFLASLDGDFESEARWSLSTDAASDQRFRKTLLHCEWACVLSPGECSQVCQSVEHYE